MQDRSRTILNTLIAHYHPSDRGATDREEENRKPASYMTWRQPDPYMVALAKERGWSAEEREQRMKHHIYDVVDYEFTDTTIRFKAEFQGIE
jgi:hypothetical protein